jgi:hypothetical protein
VKAEAPSAAPERPVPPSPPPLESAKTLPATTEKTPPPPVAVKPEPRTPTAGDAVLDARTVDVAAIRETLRRYADAYQSRDIAAVKKVLPALSSQQLRNLEKDLSNYRSYNVEITGARTAADNASATVVCDVTRSFVTKGGIAGGNTVATIFHLKKVEGSWLIEKLESR